MSFRKRSPLHQIAYEPDLVPPPDLMRTEGIEVLEEWFRWAEEWSMLLRVYGGITRESAVLEIGCGLGRTAFPLRYILSADGSYDGFEIAEYKVRFLEHTFHEAHPNFRFIWANVHNTYYNPHGNIPAAAYSFPYPASAFDVVYAASVFTHMLPDAAAHYFHESARVLKPGGRCVFSFFLLDYYHPGQPRPAGFARPAFNFDHRYGAHGDDFAIGVPDNPEEMTAYRLSLIEQFARQAELELTQAPMPGFWSGSTATWVGAQDVVVLTKPVSAPPVRPPAAERDLAPQAVDSHPPISVIVCTRDRAQLLEGCLQSLRALDYENYEVVVVDNASRDDATARAVAATPFRYVREELPGLDWARNRGAAEAKHAIIAYIDDDARADPGWLKGIAQAFADACVSAVTGLVRPAEMETRAQQLFEQYGGMGKGLTPRTFQRDALQPHELIASHACGVGANMAFRRSVFETLGGFDTALDVGTPACGGGDLDMFHNVLAAGLALRYEPTALVWHQHRRDMEGLRRQIYNNGRSHGVYLIKVWRSNRIARPALATYALRWVGGWLLARLVNRLRGRLRFPLAFVWVEMWGALHAPWAYVATHRHDRRLRSALPHPPREPRIAGAPS